MRVLLSFSHKDGVLAAKLEEALRSRNIETWSSLDLHTGEDWREAVDEASAKADSYIFLLNAATFSDPHVQLEWRAMLRNDWESKKTLIPVATSRRLSKRRVPPFLRNRYLLSLTDLDRVSDRIAYLLQHPDETRDHSRDAKNKREAIRRLAEIQEFALALENYNDQRGVEHR